jgi:NADP-dependent aldehyde dehydrogenase
MLIAIGPVVVFGASNFPLAFSVAGGDTTSALAAGNPVIVKAHPAHPGTSEMVGRAIVQAVEETGMPEGVFSLLQGASPELSLDLVRHSSAAAVGFTGSLKAGRAIYDAATRRPSPVPVFAEMGSINPVFVLPGAMSERGDAIAEGLRQSITLGVGQFCTSPGLVVGLQNAEMNTFVDRMESLLQLEPPATMLYPGILRSYHDGLKRLEGVDGVRVGFPAAKADETRTEAHAAVFATDSETFLQHQELSEEVFGPATLMVGCASPPEMMSVARSLQGHLTATIHGTQADLEEFKDLISLLQKKVGRLIYNGFPTGVEVCAAMQHGGPYPATTDARWTSVGTAAIKRFARPVCFQNFPQEALPVALRDQNQRGIWRTVDNQFTLDDCCSEPLKS